MTYIRTYVQSYNAVSMSQHSSAKTKSDIHMTLSFGWSCILNSFILSYLVSLLFADLLSLNLVTFLMFFSLVQNNLLKAATSL